MLVVSREFEKWKDNVEKSWITKKDRNRAYITGRLKGEFRYDHVWKGETFYRNKVIVERLSGAKDVVPINVAKSLLEEDFATKNLKEKWIEVDGQLETCNRKDIHGNSHLKMFLAAGKIKIYEENEIDSLETMNGNWVYLEGYICKQPVIRKTSTGREIADIILAVNRENFKCAYIPCIVWSHPKCELRNFKVGTKLKFHGRIQSRIYPKKIVETPYIWKNRETYEVSVMRMLSIDDKNC